MRAMILAAGFGERLRPLTEKTPKPLLEVGGKPLIQYHIEHLAQAGIREIVINTSWLGEMIEAFLGNGSRFGVEIFWSRETEPLETGGGIRRALPHLGADPFLVINGDIWTDFPLQRLVGQDWSEETDGHLVLAPNPAFNQSGDFRLCEGGWVHYPEEGQDSYTFSGVSVLRPEIFALHSSGSEKFPLRNVLENSIRARAVSGEVHAGQWWDVGTVERLQELNLSLLGKVDNALAKPRVRLQTA